MRIEQKIIIPLVMICLGNLITLILEKDLFPRILFFVTPFLIISISLLIYSKHSKKSNDKIISASLLFIACLGTWFGGDTSLISATLLCFAIHITKHEKTYISTYAVCQTVSVAVQFWRLGLSSAQTLVYLAGSAFIFIFYHHYVYQDKHKPPKLVRDPVSSEVVQIMNERIKGYDWEEISDILSMCVTKAQVRRKVADERKRLGFKNQDEFTFYLVDNGIITSKRASDENALTKETACAIM